MLPAGACSRWKPTAPPAPPTWAGQVRATPPSGDPAHPGWQVQVQATPAPPSWLHQRAGGTVSAQPCLQFPSEQKIWDQNERKEERSSCNSQNNPQRKEALCAQRERNRGGWGNLGWRRAQWTWMSPCGGAGEGGWYNERLARPAVGGQGRGAVPGGHGCTSASGLGGAHEVTALGYPLPLLRVPRSARASSCRAGLGSTPCLGPDPGCGSPSTTLPTAPGEASAECCPVSLSLLGVWEAHSPPAQTIGPCRRQVICLQERPRQAWQVPCGSPSLKVPHHVSPQGHMPPPSLASPGGELLGHRACQCPPQ